jgi:hypothetical protein
MQELHQRLANGNLFGMLLTERESRDELQKKLGLLDSRDLPYFTLFLSL